MKRATLKQPSEKERARHRHRGDCSPGADYFRPRDFEYVQPLYDLAFLLEVAALAKGDEVPKYRTFSLWRAAHSLDSYAAMIDQWLDGVLTDGDLDYVPSSRIRQYLSMIRRTGTITELRAYRAERFQRCLRLRSVRGLGPSKIALTVASRSLAEHWFSHVALDLSLDKDRINEIYQGGNSGPWQVAHIFPPLARFLQAIEAAVDRQLRWQLSGLESPFESARAPIDVSVDLSTEALLAVVDRALKRERFFRCTQRLKESLTLAHQMGWSFVIRQGKGAALMGLADWVARLDPLGSVRGEAVQADLHMHTAWSDGSASLENMAAAAAGAGLSYIAITDHSRSSKLQGGLTPVTWLRQANALRFAKLPCPVLHGIEVDILRDGSLDLPVSLLSAADIVVASVHSNWTSNARANTDRLLKAIESGCIDILAHPTSALTGKPGVPNYVRPPAEIHWQEVFQKCAAWCVALEFNSFPSRLDLPLSLLRLAVQSGCAISVGSDAHARAHLLNRKFGDAALDVLQAPVVLNRFSHRELRRWIANGREKRSKLTRGAGAAKQEELPFEGVGQAAARSLVAEIDHPRHIPTGSSVVGIDLTAGDKATGVALLAGFTVSTCSLISDDEILAFIAANKPKIVSIDSPLGLPGGGDSINPEAGIVRIAEHDLASIGIPAYPALIDSMRKLTLRGIRLKRAIELLPCAPVVIESYPGAAQDILCIPRKQIGLDLLRQGLRRLGLKGDGLNTRSHDEMDAITAAVVGRYFEAGDFEPMGIPSEAQLIVPKIRPLNFHRNPIICLGGKTGAGKSVVARYLSVFYGFEWVRTRNVIRELLLEDLQRPCATRLLRRAVDPTNITETDLRDFGSVVLDDYQQIPLSDKLTRTVAERDVAIVVDSIRGADDVNASLVTDRPVMTWFVDCPDSVIRQRLLTRSKQGVARIKGESPVDHTAAAIRRFADKVVSNHGSLEDLRWRVDDALFSVLNLCADAI